MSRPAPRRRTALVLGLLLLSRAGTPVPATAAPASAPPAVDVVATSRTPPLDGPVLDLAFLDDDRLVVLGPDAVALFVWDAAGLAVESRRPLAGPFLTVRSPGGLLRVAESDRAFWALTSRSDRAQLFAFEERRLVERQEAAAVPWPGCAGGLRYRPGTNLIEGTIAGGPAGPYLGLDDTAPLLAVSAEGILRSATADGPPTGPALTALWPGAVAASSPRPPGEEDAILIVATTGAGEPRLVESLRVEGAVRALAARERGATVRLVAAVEEPDEVYRLLILDLARPQP